METEGVMVVTTAQIPTNMETLSSPCEGSLQQGDYITSINGNPVNSKEELVSSVEACAGQPLTLHIVREQESFDISVLPIQDTSGTYRLGVWVKDDVQGIGTLTYISEDGHFGALGHPINDSDTGKRVSVRKGGLKEKLVRSALMQTAYKEEVVCGKAFLRCAVNGEPQDYEVEIIKTQPGSTGGFQICVTDKVLLEKTGGIIQGMSGSPLIQNGKMIGAVTHVFVNDPTKGYAIYAEDMLNH